MISLILLGAVITLAVGAVAKFYLDRSASRYEIDKKEFAIVGFVMCLVVIPGTAYVGIQMAIKNQVTYVETWSGWEEEAVWIKTKCSRDGPCIREYDCDPYIVMVDYECGTSEQPRTCQRPETRYHDCPYTTYEWTFKVETTVGDHTIAYHNLPTNPDQHRWRSGVRVPDRYASGVPAFWAAVDARLKANSPGPACARKTYDNYILASQSSILQRFNDSIERYSNDGLLPAVAQTADVRDFYALDRVYFAGMTVGGDWQGAVQRFNAAFGTMLQGDLHLVIVNANTVTDRHNYFGALMAYWQSEAFGDQALSKNGLVIAVGTKDGKTIEWAKAGTGMPIGNEMLVVQLEDDLKGQALTPENILGHATASFDGAGELDIKPHGKLADIVWGPNKFKRVSMSGDGDDAAGFSYLLNEIEPTTGQKIGILFVVFLFACIGWGISIAYGERMGFHRSYNRRY